MSQPRGCRLRAPSERCGGPSLGELSGGNWMAVVDGRLFTGVVSVAGRACPLLGKGRPYLVTTNFYPPFGGCVAVAARG